MAIPSTRLDVAVLPSGDVLALDPDPLGYLALGPAAIEASLPEVRSDDPRDVGSNLGTHEAGRLYNLVPTQTARTNVRSANRADSLRLELQMAEEAERIGGRMRERRLELGLTQREVADRIPGSTEGKDISRWEGGHHRPVSDTLDAIATALETDVGDLYAGPVATRKSKGPTPDLLSKLDRQTAQSLSERLDEALEILHSLRAALAAAEIDPRPDQDDGRSGEDHPEAQGQ